MKKIILSALFLGLMFGATSQTRLYVDTDATGANDGSSWADAFTELSDAATYLDTITNKPSQPDIWVAEGTYTPDPTGLARPQEATFKFDESVNLYGGFNGTETAVNQADPVVHETILSGDLNGNDNGEHTSTNSSYYDNCYNVITMPSSTFAQRLFIKGFTIKGGRASSGPGRGAAINCAHNLNVNQCIFEDNFGVLSYSVVYANPFYASNCWVYECKFRNNTGGRSIIGVSNSGQRRTYSRLYLYNNEFYENKAERGIVQGHQYYLGSSATNRDIEYYIYNNLFYKNTLSDAEGAPVYLHHQDNQGIYMFKVDVIGNIFWENDAENKAVYVEDRTSNTKELERLYFLSNLIDGTDTLTLDSLHVDQTPWNGFAGRSYVQSNIYNVYPMFNDTSVNDFSITDCNAPGNDLVAFTADGMPQSYKTRDHLGNNRNVGIRIDIGPYEVQNSFTGFTAEQQDTLIVATSGYEPYTWYDNRNPQNPVLLPDTTNTLVPAGDGEYIVLARNADGCGVLVEVDFCGQVKVSLSASGDSIEAVGTGGSHYNFGLSGNNIVQRTRNNKVAIQGYGEYTVSHFGWNGSSLTTCVARSTFNYCGDIPNVTITQNDSSLVASVDDAANYQWYRNDTAIQGATNATFPLASAADGSYSVEVSENECSGTSNKLDYCSGIPNQPEVLLTDGELGVDGNFDSYQWYLDGAPITGATSATHTPTENGSYTVKVTASGCEREAKALAYDATGIVSLKNAAVRIYPNPANESITIDHLPQFSEVRITDLTGKTVALLYPKEQSVQLTVQSWEQGMYLVQITKNQEVITSLLTIQE